MSYPNDFNCPIGLKLLQDPVICADGITYEREAIEHWFQQPQSRTPFDPDLRISPVTKKLIEPNLIPNIALRNAIEEYFKNNPDAKDLLSIDTQKFFPIKENTTEDVVMHEDIHNAAANNLPVVAHVAQVVVPEGELQLKCNGITNDHENYKNVYLSVVPPNQGPKRNTVYINVVDVSGSMQLPAMSEQAEGEFQYSRLDLVKYSLENVVENCEDDDYFALVTFSNSAEVVMPITRMDKAGKTLAKHKIYEQETQGATNLWGGMLAGLELVKNEICKQKNVTMIVLTDGEANQNPPRGVYATLESYLEKANVCCSINTLGFGYDIDSQLLYDIALKLGNGTYCFIPDCTMIGTNVTSLIAKNKTCFAKSVELKLTIEGARWAPEFHDLLNLNTSLYTKDPLNHKLDVQVLDFGPMEYGQARDLVLRLKDVTFNGNIKVEVTYNTCGRVHENKTEVNINDVRNNEHEVINEFYDRNLFIKAIFDLINIRNQKIEENKKLADINTYVNRLLAELKARKNEKFIREFETIVHEREGQVAKAISRADWFKKWGLAHLLYLNSSHIRRFNANFKDPSIQKYGGEIFEKNRGECENLFCTLQQPKPSIRNYNRSYSNNQNYNKAPISIAQACCDIDAGCFAGDGEVLMKNGELKKVCELLPGDELQSWNKETCKILCVIRTRCTRPTKTVKINGLRITPYHPVFINTWKFPIDVSNVEENVFDYVYNLVVDREHVVIIDGVKCVTLGHNYQENVVAHPYFGSQKVIEDLQKMKGWENGYIRIDCILTTRDECTGLINSMIQGEYLFDMYREIDGRNDNRTSEIISH